MWTWKDYIYGYRKDVKPRFKRNVRKNWLFDFFETKPFINTTYFYRYSMSIIEIDHQKYSMDCIKTHWGQITDRHKN
jgi:hypothetical protein